ncbi:MAG TPA: hypothetical protein VNA20_13815 [Frankiaceae bacterium]|nr:hypothetical protein [Frankiaceae bacterium]
MSESFPFAAAEEADPGTDRKKLVVVAGIGALLVAVLGYFVVVPALAGDAADPAPRTMVKKAPQKSVKGKADAKAKAKTAPAKKPVAAPPATYSDLSARANPFRELWKEPTQSGAGSSAPGGPAAAPVGPAQPAPVYTGGGQAAPGGGQSSGGSSAAVGGQRVALMTVYAKGDASYAQTRVGDVVYTPRVGQVFAVSYKLLAVSGKTATYLYGDEQFTLSVGQEVLK